MSTRGCWYKKKKTLSQHKNRTDLFKRQLLVEPGNIMLNPNANEFKPGQFGPPSTETSAAKSQSQETKPTQQQQQQHSKRRPPKSTKPQQNQQKQQKSHVKSDRRSSSDQHQSKKSNRSKNQQQTTDGSGSGVGGLRRHKGGSSSSTQQQQQQSATSSSSSTPRQADNDSFGLLTKFITIEEAIDPVFRTRPTEDGSTNLDGNSSSTGEVLGKLIHGYERYIEWVKEIPFFFSYISWKWDYQFNHFSQSINTIHQTQKNKHI